MILLKRAVSFVIFIAVLCAFETAEAQHFESRLAGPVLRSNGFGLMFSQRQMAQDGRSLLFVSEVLSHRHPAEMRILSSDNFDPGTYTYGKINHCGLLRAGGGMALNLNASEYGRKNGVYVQLHTGPQLIALKPVYLRVLNYSQQDDGFVRMEQFNASDPQRKELIMGEAPFSYGLNETQFKAGWFFKSSVSFEWINQSGGSRQFELGMCLDYMPQSTIIMALRNQPWLQTTFYSAFVLGKTSPPDSARPVF